MANSTVVRMAGVGVSLYLAAAGTAEAAKGVKKVAPANNAPRMVSGVVLNVSHKNGVGLFHVRTAQHRKKMGAVNPGVNAAVNQPGVAGNNQLHHTHAFHVTAATRFGHQNGTPASLAALHRGERVRVQATGNQAVAVQILSQHRTRGSFTRYRVNNYRPHLYQHHIVHRRRK